MRSQTAYLVVMMVVMAGFALFRMDQHVLVLLPGNLLVALALIGGALAVSLKRPFSLAVGLASAGLTSAMGVLALLERFPRYLRLPGYPLIWVVIGLYIGFRLVINQKYLERVAAQANRKTADAPPAVMDARGDARGDA